MKRFLSMTILSILLLLFFASCGQKPVTNFNLHVQVEGEGSIYPILGSFAKGELVIFDIRAKEGWNFSHWAGRDSQQVVYNNYKYQVLIDKDINLVGVFTKVSSDLELELTVEIEGSGTVNPSSGKFKEGTVIGFQVEARAGWSFSHWEGQNRYDLFQKEGKWSLIMDSPKHLIAIFVPESYDNKKLELVIVGKGYVERQIISQTKDYPAGSLVRLTARADRGWQFDSWAGDAEGSKDSVDVLMNSDKVVVALFKEHTENRFWLDINVRGNGRVFIYPDKADYAKGEKVQLTAAADSGWQFKEWRGDASGTNPELEVIMTANKNIEAVFLGQSEERFRLDVSVNGNGRVSIYPDKADYASGEKVQLTAIADSGWQFKEWRGDASGTNLELEVIMTANKNIEAVFTKTQTGGTAEISGSIQLKHTWPHVYTVAKSRNIGKIPVLDNLGPALMQTKAEYVPGELIVSFRDEHSNVSILGELNQLEMLQAAGLTILNNISEIDAYLVAAPMDEVGFEEERARLASLDGVMYVEPNYILHALSASSIRVPNDPLYDQQWHYRQLRLPHAWSVTTGSSSIRVAVLDTGVNHNHPDLSGRVDTSDGWNFFANNDNAMDGHGHGTHCAGTIAANSNNSLGVAGVMWSGQIVPVKVLNDSGSGSLTAIVDGILYAAGELSSKPISRKADILSMSLGSMLPIPTMQNACKKAVEAGCLIVVAAGNSNGPISYPGRYSECITIGSTGYNYPNTPKRAPYSSYGKELDVMTPGGDTKVDSDNNGHPDGVLSTIIDGYDYYQGTSMACPHAAGVCGLMLANGIPASEVRTVLRRTAMDLGGGDFSNEFGYGLVNAYWAVCDVKEIKIIVGTKTGNRINPVASGTIDLRDKTYNLSNIPAGEYQVFGWVDVQNTGTLEAGDYLFESSKMSFQNGQKLTIDMELTEIK